MSLNSLLPFTMSMTHVLRLCQLHPMRKSLSFLKMGSSCVFDFSVLIFLSVSSFSLIPCLMVFFMALVRLLSLCILLTYQ